MPVRASQAISSLVRSMSEPKYGAFIECGSVMITAPTVFGSEKSLSPSELVALTLATTRFP